MPILPVSLHEAQNAVPAAVAAITERFGPEVQPQGLLWFFEWNLKALVSIDLSDPRAFLESLMTGDLTLPSDYFIGMADERAEARCKDLVVTLNAKDQTGKRISYEIHTVPLLVREEVLAYCEAEVEAEIRAIEAEEEHTESAAVVLPARTSLTPEELGTLNPDLLHTQLISALTTDDWQGADALLGVLHQLVQAGRLPRALHDTKALSGFRLGLRKRGFSDPLPGLCWTCSGQGCMTCGRTGMVQ